MHGKVSEFSASIPNLNTEYHVLFVLSTGITDAGFLTKFTELG
jgi:hypothetical protein